MLSSTSPAKDKKRYPNGCDPYEFIYEINYSKDLFNFLKSIYPNIKPKKSVARSYEGKSNGTRKKASIIVCPHKSCKTYIVELEEWNTLAELFDIHMRNKHNLELSEDFVKRLSSKITYIRTNKNIYSDSFVYVSWEEVVSESCALAKTDPVENKSASRKSRRENYY